jgi:type VI secretion system protein ImpG
VTRTASTRKGDEGTDVSLSLVDLSARPMHLDYDTVTVRCTCTNRDLITRLPFGSENGDFEMTGAAAIKRIVALRKPTRTLRPPLDGQTLWSLISQLSLNYLSIVGNGREALQKMLELHDFSDSPEVKKQIGGIISVDSRRHFTRVISEHGIGFARGTRIEMEFDEEQFSGAGAYLFASVLERFFGLYVSMNSFSQLVARSRQRKEPLEEWPPRAGQSVLI